MTDQRRLPRLSVVIVTWNSSEVVVECLRSLCRHPGTQDAEVIVVDNGSRDATVATVRETHPGVRIIANHVNRGLAAANNQGLRAAGGDVVLICNPDVVFGAGAIAAMMDVLDRHPRAAFVIPRLRYADGTLFTSAGDLPRLGEAMLGRQAQRRRPVTTTGFWWDGWAHDEERPIGRGHEAAYLVRRKAMEEIGLQDERFRLDWEGPDWTERAHQAGWEVWFCPDAEVTHLGGASVRQVPLRWLLSSHLGMYHYFAKRRPGWQRPLLAVAVAVRALLKLGAAGLGIANYERGHRGRSGAGP